MIRIVKSSEIFPECLSYKTPINRCAKQTVVVEMTLPATKNSMQVELPYCKIEYLPLFNIKEYERLLTIASGDKLLIDIIGFMGFMYDTIIPNLAKFVKRYGDAIYKEEFIEIEIDNLKKLNPRWSKHYSLFHHLKGVDLSSDDYNLYFNSLVLLQRENRYSNFNDLICVEEQPNMKERENREIFILLAGTIYVKCYNELLAFMGRTLKKYQELQNSDNINDSSEHQSKSTI